MMEIVPSFLVVSIEAVLFDNNRFSHEIPDREAKVLHKIIKLRKSLIKYLTNLVVVLFLGPHTLSLRMILLLE